MAGELTRDSLEIAADVAIMSATLLREIVNDYAIEPDQFDFNLDDLEQQLSEGNRQALVNAMPALIAQMFAQEEPTVG